MEAFYSSATDAENSVAGAILIDSRCLSDILETELTPEEFSCEQPRTVYAVALKLYRTGREIDPVIILSEAGDRLDRDYLLQAMEITPTAANAAHYARIIRSEALRRRAATLAVKLSEPGNDTAATMAELQGLATQQAQLHAIRKTGQDYFRDFVAEIQTPAFAPIKTGMRDFDNLLAGGFRPQELVILGGAPGIGKTAFTQQLFEGIAAQGMPVLYFNLEMSRQQLFARSIARLTSKDGVAVTPAQVTDNSEWTVEQGKAIEAVCRRYAQEVAPFISYNPLAGRPAGLGAILATMTAAAEQARRDGTAPPAVVLDYLQLVEGDDKQEQAEVTKKAVKALKDYAIRYATFVFVITANNRESNKTGQATVDSGRDTSAIEYTADTMLQLTYRASVVPQEREVYDDRAQKYKKKWTTLPPAAILEMEDEFERLRLKSDIILRVVKKRNGEPGRSMRFYFNGASSRFTPFDSYHREEFRFLPQPTFVPFESATEQKIQESVAGA